MTMTCTFTAIPREITCLDGGVYAAWQYKVLVTVTNAPPAGWQDYLALTFTPGMNVWFADIRFLQLDGTNIPYSLTNLVYATSVEVWLQMPSATQTSFYMYYGNPSATDASVTFT